MLYYAMVVCISLRLWGLGVYLLHDCVYQFLVCNVVLVFIIVVDNVECREDKKKKKHG